MEKGIKVTPFNILVSKNEENYLKIYPEIPGFTYLDTSMLPDDALEVLDNFCSAIIEEAESEGIVINPSWGPKEVLTADGKGTGIVFKKCLSVKNAEGRFAPSYDENDTITIECDRVIFAVGQRSVWGDLLKGEAVEFNGPAVVADSLTYQTTVPDIFIGGDVTTKNAIRIRLKL